MIFLKALCIVVEVLCCLLLIGLVLLQKSKNEGLGLAFGAGAGESLFGARAGNVLSRATVILGIVFMANSLLLGVLFAQKDKTLMEQAAPTAQPAAMQTQPVDAMDLVMPEAEPSAAEPQAEM
ncbi:MAG: preprotein translocase subunit SecG [Pseudomonadota bacterium]